MFVDAENRKRQKKMQSVAVNKKDQLDYKLIFFIFSSSDYQSHPNSKLSIHKVLPAPPVK